MRFSKAPLIATLMAVALSLLVILPALAVDSIKTDGILDKGKAEEGRVVVGVFSDRLDAQYDWQAFTAATPPVLVYDRDDKMLIGGVFPDATFAAGAPAYLLDELTTTGGDASAQHPADPRNTLFDGTLYVSNQDDAYNTVLINAQRPLSEVTDAMTIYKDAAGTPLTTASDVYCVTATVKNLRTGISLSVPLVNAADGTAAADGTDDTAVPTDYGKFQNFFEVIPNTDDLRAATDDIAKACAEFAVE